MREAPRTGVAATAPARIRIGGASRDVAVDSLRGVAIILMVAGHVVGASAAAGMQVAEDSGWRISFLLLEDVRMPLFTALSGFVYGLRPLRDPHGYPRLITGKVRRLLVPLAAVGTVFLVLQFLVPGTNASSDLGGLWKLFVYGTGHFWFLQAIFLIFLIVGIADALGVLSRPRNVIVAIAAASALAILVVIPDPWAVFSVNGAIRLLPFFLLGYLFTAHAGARGSRRHAASLLIALTAVLFTVRTIEILTPVAYPDEADRALGIALGIAAISLLLTVRERIGWAPLARLGYFSYAIYLLHVFGTAPARMALDRLGGESDVVVFSASLIAGLALPVLVEVTAGRIRWVSWTFLGQKPYASRGRRSSRPKDA